jgi:hypothetical protein
VNGATEGGGAGVLWGTRCGRAHAFHGVRMAGHDGRQDEVGPQEVAPSGNTLPTRTHTRAYTHVQNARARARARARTHAHPIMCILRWHMESGAHGRASTRPCTSTRAQARLFCVPVAAAGYPEAARAGALRPLPFASREPVQMHGMAVPASARTCCGRIWACAHLVEMASAGASGP